MTQADRVHSTPPLNTPTSRRRFLSTAATLAAGSAALALAIPPAAAAHDPVYAIIETHKAMTAALIAILDEKSRIEGEYLDKLRIKESEGLLDHLAVQRARLQIGQQFDDSPVDAAHEAEEAALTELVETIPTTLGGVIASMAYITEAAEKDYYRYSEDWLQPLIANLCEALKCLSGQEGGSDAEG